MKKLLILIIFLSFNHAHAQLNNLKGAREGAVASTAFNNYVLSEGYEFNPIYYTYKDAANPAQSAVKEDAIKIINTKFEKDYKNNTVGYATLDIIVEANPTCIVEENSAPGRYLSYGFERQTQVLGSQKLYTQQLKLYMVFPSNKDQGCVYDYVGRSYAFRLETQVYLESTSPTYLSIDGYGGSTYIVKLNLDTNEKVAISYEEINRPK